MVIVVVVYGYQFMLLVNKIVVVGNTVLILLGIVRLRRPVRPRLRPRPRGLRARQLLADVRALRADRDGQPDLVRRLPRRLVALHPEPARRRGRCSAGHPRPRSCRRWCRSSSAWSPRRWSPGEADYIVALINASPLWYAVLLIVVAFLGGLSTGITSLYGTGLDFSSVFPRLQPRAGVAVHRRARVRLHPRRPAGLRPDRQRQRVHRRDRHLHDALDDHHDHRLRRAARALQRRRPAGVQPGPARRRLLVQQRRQLARHGGLDPGRGRRACCSPTTRR